MTDKQVNIYHLDHTDNYREADSHVHIWLNESEAKRVIYALLMQLFDRDRQFQFTMIGKLREDENE